MFTSEPILWLQSFSSPALTWLFSSVTLLGYTPVYFALLLGLAFGHRLRPTVKVFVGLLLAIILGEGLKTGLGFPRPRDVDARIQAPADPDSSQVAEGKDDRGFWEAPPGWAIAAVRARPHPSYGFPSGHVASATAFFLGAGIFFRSRRVLLFAAIWVPMMAVSRMYLGKHYLADVLGGLAVGALAIAGAAGLVWLLDLEREAGKRRAARLMPLALAGIVLIGLAPIIKQLDPENIGRLVGLVAACAILLLSGLPSDRGTLFQRCGRVLVGSVVFLAAVCLIEGAAYAAGVRSTRVGPLVADAVVTAATLLVTVKVCQRLRLYAEPLGAVTT